MTISILTNAVGIRVSTLVTSDVSFISTSKLSFLLQGLGQLPALNVVWCVSSIVVTMSPLGLGQLPAPNVVWCVTGASQL